MELLSSPCHAWPKLMRPRLKIERFWRSHLRSPPQLMPVEEKKDGDRVSSIGSMRTVLSGGRMISSPSCFGMNLWQSR